MSYHCSLFEKGKIISLRENGRTVAEIAEETGRHKTTIARWLRRFEEEGEDGMNQRHKTGRPPRTSAEQDAAMVEVASCHPFMPLRDVAAAAGVEDIHVSSVSARLKKAGLETYKPCGKLALSEQNKGNRLLFAQEAIDRYPPEFWKSVVFTDEKIFRTDLTGRVRVRRPRGARHEERFTVTKDSSGRESVHCWAWIDGHGNGELHRIEGRHTADSYVAVLEDVLLPTLQAMRPGGEPYVLQQDNAPQHTARVTKAWLADHQEEINVLDWPAKSPDLNTIENVWALMTQELTEDRRCGRRLTADELWTNIKRKWEELRLRTAVFETLAGSMGRRLQCVVDAAGGCTKY